MPELPFEAPRLYAEKAVIQMLQENGGEPIHAADLTEALHMPERVVRQCVSNLIAQGEPVLSNGNGYWLAQSKEELDECIASLMRRAAHIFKRAWKLRKGAPYEEMAGYLKLALLAPAKPPLATAGLSPRREGEAVEEK